MKVVCAWCKKTLSPGEPDGRVSHGICPECVYQIEIQRRLTLSELLDEIDVPVVALDADGVAVDANAALARAVGKAPDAISGRRVGNVVECIYAQHPQVCGRTVHCTGCAIRSSIVATHRDGQSRRHVAVEKLLCDAEGAKLARFTISTEKVAGVVLLMIDDLKMLAPEAAATA